MLPSSLWLRYQHGKQCCGLDLHYNAPLKVTASCANHRIDKQVIAAPTGSGKTGVMELAILRLVSGYIEQHNQFVLKSGSLKVVYLAPIRALVQEKVKQWQQSFGSKLGLTCCELTGDTDAADGLHLDNADIICTTPEKFGRSTCHLPLNQLKVEELIGALVASADAVTRRHKDQGGMRFFSEVGITLMSQLFLKCRCKCHAAWASALLPRL